VALVDRQAEAGATVSGFDAVFKKTIYPELQQYDLVRARFEPKRTDDLRPGVAEFIGQTTEWEAYWIIEDGPYAGQWAMVPRGKAWASRGWAWVPSGDLCFVPAARDQQGNVLIDWEPERT
jgi:hypothetical protein